VVRAEGSRRTHYEVTVGLRLLILIADLPPVKSHRPGSSALPLTHRENRDAVPYCTLRGLRENHPAANSFHEKAGRSQNGFVFLSVDLNLFTEPPLSPSFHPQSLMSDDRSLPVGRPRYRRCCDLIIDLGSCLSTEVGPGVRRSHLISTVEPGCSNPRSTTLYARAAICLRLFRSGS
jgi:hypothetical protein